MRTIKRKEHALVVLGEFDPRQFQPWWFGANKLIRDSEAVAASTSMKVVHSTLTQFSLEWAQVQVVPDKFVIWTSDEGHEEPVRDLVMGTLGTLQHLQISAIGINSYVHFQVESVEVWNAIGHKLVPKDVIWDKILKTPGMKTVLVEGQHPEGFPGATFIRVEPSNVFQHSVFVEVNDHYNLRTKDGKLTRSDAGVELLKTRWTTSMKEATSIVDRLMNDL